MGQPEDTSKLEHRAAIAVLAPAIVERIAAGEVIERPASVVRELIENALDAGASHIRVELREGGLRLVRVSDDGQGIAPDELALAIAPHATSKLRLTDDLDHVRTLGFRGEALASIALAAHLSIASAVHAGLGATLRVSDDGQQELGFEARSTGTTVTARDLFHSMPARRAALRGSRFEESAALAAVRAHALAHPAVSFTAIADGSVELHTPGAGIEAAFAAIYGADVARGLLALGTVQVEGGTLHGWIAPRAFTLANRLHVLLCINGRPVHNRVLLSALESGYRPLLRKGRHPIMLARLELDPALVDVNVHPAKAEVLLRAERPLAAVVRDMVHATLGQAPAQPPDPSLRATGLYSAPRQHTLPFGRHRRIARIAEPRPRFRPFAGAPSESPSAQGLPPLRPLGQLDNALIVASSPEGHLYLVDQHRAHERLLYEALRREAAQLRAEPPIAAVADQTPVLVPPNPGQLLLEPLVIALTPRQAATLVSRLDELSELGLACEPFGGSTFLVRALPALPGAAIGSATYASELAADAAEDTPDWREHFTLSLACRAALRRGQALSLDEQTKLLDDLRGAAVTAACPHGSPIILRYTQTFLARTFEW